MKKHLSTIILVFVFLVGLSVVLYPTVSDYWNSRTQTRAIAAYQDSMKDMKPEDYTAYFEAAEDYNNRLRETPGAFTDPSLVAGYEDTLDISGTGVMGYITIEKNRYGTAHLPWNGRGNPADRSRSSRWLVPANRRCGHTRRHLSTPRTAERKALHEPR